AGARPAAVRLGRASSAPRSASATPASSTAPAPTSSRTPTARSSPPTRSRPASTTRASGPSTPTGRTPPGSPTNAPPPPWPSPASVSSPAPRASSPPSNPPTPPAGSPRPPGTAASPAAPWSSSTCPGAATRTARPSPASWSTPRPHDGPAGRANGPLSTSEARVAKMPDPGTPGPAPSRAPSQPAQGVAEPDPPASGPRSPVPSPPGARHPDPPVSGPPVGEATRRGQAVRAAVHNPGGRSGDPATPTVAPVERLEGRLEAMRREGRAALVAYGVAGYPDLDGSLAAFRAMAEAGADRPEGGPPHSRP